MPRSSCHFYLLLLLLFCYFLFIFFTIFMNCQIFFDWKETFAFFLLFISNVEWDSKCERDNKKLWMRGIVFHFICLHILEWNASGTKTDLLKEWDEWLFCFKTNPTWMTWSLFTINKIIEAYFRFVFAWIRLMKMFFFFPL